MHHHRNTAKDSLGIHAMNSFQKSTRRSLRACPPRFVEPLRIRDEDTARTLECRVDGYPRPDIRWERSGRTVGNSRRVHMIRSGDRCLLQIRMPCSGEECGAYTCVATNNVGTAQSKVAWTDTNLFKMNGSSHTSPKPSPKRMGIRSRSIERSSDSVSELKCHSTIPRNRSESGSCKPPRSSVPKSKVATFTSHIWTNKIEYEEPPKTHVRQTKETVLDANKKQLAKSMDDCRKNKRGFLNRVKIPDIFTSSKNCNATESPIKSKSPTDTNSIVNSKFYKSTDSSIDSKSSPSTVSALELKSRKAIDIPTEASHQRNEQNINGIHVNGNVRTFQSITIESKEVPNGLKSKGVGNTTAQNVTDEPEVQLTTRERIAAYLKRFENSPSSVKLKESQSEHGRIPRRTSGSCKTVVPSAENKTSRDQTFFSKFRRRMSSVDGSKKTCFENSGTKENAKDIQSNGKCTVESKESAGNLEVKVNEETFFSKFRRKSNGDGNKKICDESVGSKENVSDCQTIVKCDINHTNAPRDLDIRRDNSNYAYVDANVIMQLKDIYGFVNTSSDTEPLIETSVDNNAEKEVSDIFLGLDADHSSLKCSTCVDDLGSFKSIDVNLMDEFKDFPRELESSIELNGDQDVRLLSENTEVCQALDQELPHDENVPELKENSIPLIHIQQSPEDNDFNHLEEDSIQTIITDASKEIIEEQPSSNYSCFQKPSKGKIKYSGPLIEEECEILVEEKERRSATPEPDPQRVSSPADAPARIVRGPQSVTVLRGESVTLAVGFDGHPTPTVVWMKGGRVLRDEQNGRLSILEGAEMSAVTVGDVTADDSGKYVVSVENEGGGDSCFASVAVVGFPEPPGSEPTASEVSDHSLVVSWYGSMYDGGSVVTGYQVEMCTLTDKKWYKVASTVNTSCTVLGLSKGQKYVFRVRAENRYGVSHPSKDSKIICLDDFLQESSSDEEAESPASITVESGTSFTERFDLKEEVGKGRFGIVYRCVEVSCGRPRAAKVIRCVKAKDKEKVRQEIDIMSRLQHPKLMQVLAAFESGRNMIMVMEYISGGELFERVIADDFVLTEQDCILFMRQICSGVSYMHTNDVIHFDLKPENILCKTRSSHKIKIIDFGLARVYKEDENLRVLFGTPEFVAPEIINYEPVGPGSDMWSVGVICYVLLSGLSPFMGESDTETFSNITRGEMDFDDEAFDEISQDAKDFISRLLVKQVKKRLSADECLKHPWLATGGTEQKRPLSTEKLKRFIIRRKWQKSGTAIRALGRMVSLSRSSLSSSCDSYSPLGSPTSSRSRSSLVSRSETAESNESDVFQER